MFSGDDVATIRKLNEQNARFWAGQSKLMERRMADEVILGLAIRETDSEANRQILVYSRKTFEQALADAEETKRRVHCELARQGGRSRKGDALQKLIQEIVMKNPKITLSLLRVTLGGEDGAGVVRSIDGPSEGLARVREIHFTNDDGRPKTAALLGLKDRLTRAKARIKSR